MITTYSQPKLKNQWKDKLNRLWKLIKTKSTSDLWVKVFIQKDRTYKNHLGESTCSKATYWSGHYRSINHHGFYDKEWDFLNKHPKIKNVITLKIGESCSEEGIATLIAHEYRHYLQYKKYNYRMNYKINGRRKSPIQVERDANNWAKKRVNKLIMNKQIKTLYHKKNSLDYWLMQEALKNWDEWEFNKNLLPHKNNYKKRKKSEEKY